ncbi:MAG: glycosyltransferase family 4 protein [Salibacteraceae bacterium]
MSKSGYNKKVLVIGSCWPEPRSSAAGVRMMQLMLHFSLDGEVWFACHAGKTGNEANLKSSGINERQIILNSDTFDEWVSALKPDVVVFDRFITEEQYGWRVARSAPQALRILDTEDLHFLRKSRQHQVKNGLKEPDFFCDDTVIRELASIYRSDLSLIISKYELELLTGYFGVPPKLLMYLPFFETTPGSHKSAGFCERGGLAFIGHARHEPNRDAMDHLCKDILPLVRKKLPSIELHLAGAYMSNHLKSKLAKVPGVVVYGFVPDAREFIARHRLLVAPIRFGAGLKGKIVDAFATNTPVITTPVGAEGFSAVDWPGAVVDNTNGFVKAVVEGYTNRSTWERWRAQCARHYAEFTVQKGHAQKLNDRLVELAMHIDEHRRSNLIGRILAHQSMRSTEYFSKWLALKEELKAIRTGQV